MSGATATLGQANLLTKISAGVFEVLSQPGSQRIKHPSGRCQSRLNQFGVSLDNEPRIIGSLIIYGERPKVIGKFWWKLFGGPVV